MSDDTFDKHELANFARAVINIHDHKVFQTPIDKTLQDETRDQWNEVYAVAIGLAVLRNLADDELHQLLSKKDGRSRLGRSGLRQAIALLDALTTGKRHAVFDLTKGIQFGFFRHLRTQPNVIDKMDRDDILGLVRALIAAQRLEHGPRSQESVAIRRVVERCKLRNRFTEREIRDWNRRSKDGKPDKIAAVLLRNVQKKSDSLSLSDRLLLVAEKWAAQTFPPQPVIRKS
jgi:hypothetical protein